MKRAALLYILLAGCSTHQPVGCQATMETVYFQVYGEGVWIDSIEEYERLREYIHDLENCVLLDAVVNL